MSNAPSFVVRGDPNNFGWQVRYSHQGMGEMPVGPRLAKGTRYPNEIGVLFEDKGDAERAAQQWETWYISQPYLSKKRKAKYIA